MLDNWQQQEVILSPNLVLVPSEDLRHLLPEHLPDGECRLLQCEAFKLETAGEKKCTTIYHSVAEAAGTARFISGGKADKACCAVSPH